jgi:hypothetical protein
MKTRLLVIVCFVVFTLIPITVLAESGSYELDEAQCSIPRGMTVDENCRVIQPSPHSQQQKGIEPEDVKCNHDLYRNYKKSDGTAFCASGHTLRELIHRGYAQRFDSIESSTISGQNNTVNEYCPASQELAQWGWYAYDYPTDVIVTNIDLVFSAKENSHGVEFTFDKTAEGKAMIWIFIECKDNLTKQPDTPIHLGSQSTSESQLTSNVGLQVDVTGQKQVRRGTTHDITVDVTRNGNQVYDALVRITIEDYGKDVIREFEGRTDNSGRFVFSWEIPKSFDDIETLLAYVDVTDNISAKTALFKFQVYCLPNESGCKVKGN